LKKKQQQQNNVSTAEHATVWKSPDE